MVSILALIDNNMDRLTSEIADFQNELSLLLESINESPSRRDDVCNLISNCLSDGIHKLTTVYHPWCEGPAPGIGILGALEFAKRMVNHTSSEKVLQCNNIFSDPGITNGEKSMMRTAGFEAYLALPIYRQHFWIGVLVVQSPSARVWDAEDVQLLNLTARYLVEHS
jgi:hypothetical protein